MKYSNAKRNIEWKLSLGVMLGEYDEEISSEINKIIQSLSDSDVNELINITEGRDDEDIPGIVFKFLCDRNYILKELVSLKASDELKDKLQIEDWD
jgi:hypothetical protein